ncbi:putative enoyl-CoA hydratase echA17 [Mycolicibacterium confluentis]|uniref:Putative enoyl-CoA hydratase echA17 n=1 Tax=Mycolicibacterium confluentis TaxID=28047 RepID=A0A7I7XYR7_9MYCO|nr:enoyl-CoA hydratase [Mycolicibacterium confluentis]BBZ34446.1 putative enoyl-CoA hydratase echA17 [Mycolicibacterium confluentis]
MTAPVPEFVGLHTHPEHPGVGTLLLSRPPTNALSRQMLRELTQVAHEAGARDDIAVVILYGGHEIFSAGDDVPELRTLSAAEAVVAARVRDDAMAAVAAIPKPTVAAITGYALGSGLSLALAADWRIAGDNVKTGATEILAGLVPSAASLARLAEITGRSRAKDMVFTGRFVDAEESELVGLFDQLVAPDDVYDAACAWAKRHLDAPAVAVAAAKAMLDGQCSPDEQRRRYEEVFSAALHAPEG